MGSARSPTDCSNNNNNLLLRSRAGGRNSTTVLPLVHPAPNQTLPRHASSTTNNFLHGGMYVPNKDKKRRAQQRRSRSNRVYRFRITAEIVDLWLRLWYTSPVVAITTGLLVSCLLMFYIVIPIASSFFVAIHENGALRRPRRRGIDWLLTDTLLLEMLPSAKEERVRVERFAMERVQKQGDKTRLEVLELLAPYWYHRNDLRKATQIAGGANAKIEPEQEVKSPKNQEDVVTVSESERQPTDPVSAKVLSSEEKTQSDGEGDTHRRLLRTLQTIDMIANNSRCPVNLSDTDLETTLVVQSSLDRVWVLDETCRRWKAPIVAVVAVKAEEKHRVEHDLVGWRDKCPQLNLIVYYLNEDIEGRPEQYPVNVLRNMALDAVQTSHVLVVDVDFVPSATLDKTVHSVLLEQCNQRSSSVGFNATINEKEAVVVPAFQRLLSPPCTTDKDCKRHLRLDSSFIPHSFDDLQRCHKAKDCIVFQNDVNWPGHSSTRSNEWLDRNWYDESNETRRIRSINCFDSLRYEPYVVIRWCPTATQEAAREKMRRLDYENASGTENDHSTDLQLSASPVAPYYDERFHGYGKNKIEHISHLRMLGYKFSVLPEGFIVHNPHVESAVKEKWNNMKKSKLHESMDVLYQQFLHELVDKYYNQFGAEVVAQCSQHQP